jgi:hypothetical protein
MIDPQQTIEERLLAKIEAIDFPVQELQIKELPELPRPTDCSCKNIFTRQAPNGKGRGPPGFVFFPTNQFNTLNQSQCFPVYHTT